MSISPSCIKPVWLFYFLFCYRDTLLHQHKEFKANTDYYRKELTKLIEEKNFYHSDSQEVLNCLLDKYLK